MIPRGMGVSPGEESCDAAVAPQAIEALAGLRPDLAMEETGWSGFAAPAITGRASASASFKVSGFEADRTLHPAPGRAVRHAGRSRSALRRRAAVHRPQDQPVMESHTILTARAGICRRSCTARPHLVRKRPARSPRRFLVMSLRTKRVRLTGRADPTTRRWRSFV